MSGCTTDLKHCDAVNREQRRLEQRAQAEHHFVCYSSYSWVGTIFRYLDRTDRVALLTGPQYRCGSLSYFGDAT